MLLTESYDYGRAETLEFAPTPVTTFMVRRFGDDLMRFLHEGGFQVTRLDYTGRNDASGDYFFVCCK